MLRERPQEKETNKSAVIKRKKRLSGSDFMEYEFYDIVNKHRPEHKDDVFAAKHPKMRRQDRAKIFAPFAALSGHAEQTHAQERVTVEKIDLSQDAVDEINIAIQEIEEKLDLKETVIAEVIHFVPDEFRVGEGAYNTISGAVEKIDVYNCVFKINGIKIKFENIYKVLIIKNSPAVV